MRTGSVELGAMGCPMALSVLAAGHELSVDRGRTDLDELIREIATTGLK
jgi:2-hydroxy-3-oxopropionate reductase